MKKAELRKFYLTKQKNLSPAERIEKSRAVAEHFFRFFDLTAIEYLHCFIPIEKFNEIETALIFQKIWLDFPNIKTLAPRVNFQTAEIENLKSTPETELIENSWQIGEPGGNELIETEKVDLVLAPLLCCDLEGSRVGYGNGFYDKFLRRSRPNCLKIGLSYFPPTAIISDVNEYDVKLDYCVTPEKIYKFNA
jgi:5-formyltetrahydrofolate cyclo-ligase